ncbi:MAG: hypothetical protein P8105_03545 [Dehalococcoidia bacterium]
MMKIVKWLLGAISILLILYAILLLIGVFNPPFYLPYCMLPVILILAGVGILFLTLGISSSSEKD